MKNLQNRVLLDAYKILKDLMQTKSMTEGSKRALRVRLEILVENEEKTFDNWEEMIKPKLNTTRKRIIEREFRKRIQAGKIVINWLTPFFERTEDVPSFVVRKGKSPNLDP